jgi:hypothetical protein
MISNVQFLLPANYFILIGLDVPTSEALAVIAVLKLLCCALVDRWEVKNEIKYGERRKPRRVIR